MPLTVKMTPSVVPARTMAAQAVIAKRPHRKWQCDIGDVGMLDMQGNRITRHAMARTDLREAGGRRGEPRGCPFGAANALG